MRNPRSVLLLLTLLSASAGLVAAQAVPDPVTTAEEMVAREELRSAVEQALELAQSPASSGAMTVYNFVSAGDDLERLGAAAVPYLAAELDQGLANSYFLCAYALGRIGGSEAEEALRRAIVKAERDPGDYAADRKGWAIYGLALMGMADAVNLLYEGRHLPGPRAIHQGFSLVEVAALLTAPESTPSLFTIQARLAEDPEMLAQRIHVLRALWRVPDRANVPKLAALATDENKHIRREAAHALAFIPTPEARAAVIAALEDPDPQVRTVTARCLEWSENSIDPAVIAGKLETETESETRSAYYRLLADRMGPAALPVLQQHWGRPDGMDRVGLIHAVSLSGSSDSLPLLRKALADADPRVVAWAIRALSKLEDNEVPAILLQMVHSAKWIAAQSAVEQLLAAPSDKAAAAISNRLFEVELAGVMKEVQHRHRSEYLANALVQLDHTRSLPELRKAEARQTDPTLKKNLQRTIVQLEAIEQFKKEPAQRIEALQSESPDIRAVAYRHLARDGGAEGASAIGRTFGRVEPEEGSLILYELAASRTAPAQDLIERVLTTPQFDPADRSALRSMAAWSAWKIGGERMAQALRDSAKRRDGRDAPVLNYLALLEGEAAIPFLTRYRLVRLRYMKGSRGDELRELDWLARRIETGRSLARFEVLPDDLRY